MLDGRDHRKHLHQASRQGCLQRTPIQLFVFFDAIYTGCAQRRPLSQCCHKIHSHLTIHTEKPRIHTLSTLLRSVFFSLSVHHKKFKKKKKKNSRGFSLQQQHLKNCTFQTPSRRPHSPSSTYPLSSFTKSRLDLPGRPGCLWGLTSVINRAARQRIIFQGRSDGLKLQ